MPRRKNLRHLMSFAMVKSRKDFFQSRIDVLLFWYQWWGLVVDNQNIGGRDSFLSFLDNGLWGHLKGMDGVIFLFCI